MWIYKSFAGCLLFAVIFASVSNMASAEEFIVEEGKANAEIIISPEPARTLKLAADELQLFIRKLSGVELPIVSKPSGDAALKIYLGESDYTRELGLLDQEFENDSYRIVSGKDYLAVVGNDKDKEIIPPFPENDEDMEHAQAEWDKISGGLWNFHGRLQKRGYSKSVDVDMNDEKGTLNGVYDFIRSLGVRWYFPGEFGECVPTQKSIALPAIDKSVTPEFTMRIFGGRNYTFSKIGRDLALWSLRLGFGGSGPNAMHGVNHILRVEKTAKEHPDWYRVKDGKREASIDGRPCLSAKGFREEMIKFANVEFDMYDIPIFSVTPTDGYVNICQCDLCKPQETPDRGYRGKMSDYVWGYANEIATALYKTHPDKKVQCNSYTSYTLPPTKIEELPPNMTICFQQNRYRFGDPEKREWCLELRKSWLEKLPGNKPLSNHDNYSEMGRSPFPMFIPRLIAEDMRSLKGISYGDYIEENSRGVRGQNVPLNFAINHLNIYVTSRFWWDADQNIDAMLDEYYEKFYGPAAKEMKAFIEFSEANWEKMKKKDVEIINKTFELIDEAKQAVDKESVYGQRVHLVDSYLYKLRQLEDKYALKREDNGKVRLYPEWNRGIKLDGILDERLWQFGVGHKLKTAKHKTWFRSGFGRDVLYFAVHCEVPEMKALEGATTKNDDPAIQDGDRIEILLETQNHSYYQVVVNPAGAILDADRKDGFNVKWDSEATVAIHKGTNYWNAEIMIPVADEMQEENLPLQMISGRRPTMVETWFFRIARLDERETGESELYDASKFRVLYME